MHSISRRVIAGLAAALLVAPCFRVAAQEYPTRAVTVIVPQAPGGTNDIVARVLAEALSQSLGQPFVVENRPGAGGNIGTQAAARAKPDGYTLLVTISSSQAINPALYKQIPFNPVKDFAPITLLGSVPNVLVANPSFPANSMQELIAVAKAKPGELKYASAGNGTLNHLLGEMLKRSAGIDLVHVPYKGVAPAITDILGGFVDMGFASLPSVVSHIRSGKLKAFGVSTARRAPALPDVPAIGESVGRSVRRGGHAQGDHNEAARRAGQGARHARRPGEAGGAGRRGRNQHAGAARRQARRGSRAVGEGRERVWRDCRLSSAARRRQCGAAGPFPHGRDDRMT
jgi:tripartite-type tricarboxylate transporter receptor subunit TctC